MADEFRDELINEIWQRARQSDSAMLRVLSRGEVEWLLEPMWTVDLTDQAMTSGSDSGRVVQTDHQSRAPNSRGAAYPRR